MTYFTEAQAVELANTHLSNSGYENLWHAYAAEVSDLCNAAAQVGAEAERKRLGDMTGMPRIYGTVAGQSVCLAYQCAEAIAAMQAKVDALKAQLEESQRNAAR